jgi:hypothetical protein
VKVAIPDRQVEMNRGWLFLWLAFVLPVQADRYEFWLNRFGCIRLETGEKMSKVEFEQGNKEKEEIVWKSDLTTVDNPTFKTKAGTTFKLVKLQKPVVHDENRHINSGNWQIEITGEGKEFQQIRDKLPFVAFGDTGKPVFYGDPAKD